MAALKDTRAVFARLIERHRGRIGMPRGDAMVDGGDLFGEGVNLAARLQGMAEPGGILISQAVYEQVRSKLSVGFEFLGQRRPKNLAEPVPVYRLLFAGGPAGAAVCQETTAPTSAPPGDLSRVLRRQAQRSAIVWTGLAAINLFVDGGGFWAVWPGIALLVALGLRAAPLIATERLDALLVRLTVIVAGLALVNLASWSGQAWFLWPAWALLNLYLSRRNFRR